MTTRTPIVGGNWKMNTLLASATTLADAVAAGSADVAAEVVQGLAKETFLILPHKEVIEYSKNKSEDYDRWLGGMRKLRRRFGNPQM